MASIKIMISFIVPLILIILGLADDVDAMCVPCRNGYYLSNPFSSRCLPCPPHATCHNNKIFCDDGFLTYAGKSCRIKF